MSEASTTIQAAVTRDDANQTTVVRVVDLDIKFVSLVWLMIKTALAAIPAAVILAVMWAFVLALFVR